MSEFLIWLGNILMIAGIVLLVGLVVVWYILRRFNDRLEHQLAELVQELEERIIGLEVEVDNNQYFLYNIKDKSFICQGATAEEIKQRFMVRCPTQNAYFAGGDERAIEYLTQEFVRLKDETSHSQ
jgi:membrane protein implicated in regulation of membrane protease activity